MCQRHARYIPSFHLLQVLTITREQFNFKTQHAKLKLFLWQRNWNSYEIHRIIFYFYLFDAYNDCNRLIAQYTSFIMFLLSLSTCKRKTVIKGTVHFHKKIKKITKIKYI